MLEIGGNGTPVVVGVPCMGELRMWSAEEEFVYFTDDSFLPSLLGWGRVSRARFGSGGEREIGFLDQSAATLTLLPRESGAMLAEGVPFRGHIVALGDAPDPLIAGLHELEAVLESAVFHAAMTGETVRLSPGRWSVDQGPDEGIPGWLECAVHRQTEWDEHIALVTAPDPSAASPSSWSDSRDHSANEMSIPLHGDGIARAVALIVDAAARWGVDPPGLMLTFGEARP
ncbi:hypothetical protein [Tsukamurella sp. USMM236]|uniref:hypothetical protein n=1 Tax=Tsukamurella sp. USMM236 TaxID=3081301 RepID=UPI003015A840